VFGRSSVFLIEEMSRTHKKLHLIRRLNHFFLDNLRLSVLIVWLFEKALILNIQLLPHKLYQPLKEHIHIHTPGIIFISLHPLMGSIPPICSSLSSGFTLETPPNQMSQRKW